MMQLQLGRALATVRDENGFIGVQHDPFAIRSEEGEAAYDELLHPFGFASIPLDGGSCRLFFFGDNRESFAWLGSDRALVDKCPPIKKGGSCQYAADGQFANMDPELHTWTLYTPYEAGKAHLLTSGVDGNGKPIIELSSGEGPAFTCLDRVWTWSSANGANYVVLDDTGTSVVGPFKAAGGADLGGPGSLPLTKFPPLATQQAAVQAALTAIGAALANIVAIPLNAAAVPGVTAAATAITAAATALAALSAAGPCLTTKGA
jgi:hypothetical protein